MFHNFPSFSIISHGFPMDIPWIQPSSGSLKGPLTVPGSASRAHRPQNCPAMDGTRWVGPPPRRIHETSWQIWFTHIIVCVYIYIYNHVYIYNCVYIYISVFYIYVYICILYIYNIHIIYIYIHVYSRLYALAYESSIPLRMWYLQSNGLSWFPCKGTLEG